MKLIKSLSSYKAALGLRLAKSVYLWYENFSEIAVFKALINC